MASLIKTIHAMAQKPALQEADHFSRHLTEAAKGDTVAYNEKEAIQAHARAQHLGFGTPEYHENMMDHFTHLAAAASLKQKEAEKKKDPHAAEYHAEQARKALESVRSHSYHVTEEICEDELNEEEFHHRLHGDEDHRKMMAGIVKKNAKASLEAGLVRANKQDEALESIIGGRSTASKARAKMKITDKHVDAFLGSRHGHHIADAVNLNINHHDETKKRAHDWIKTFDHRTHMHEETQPSAPIVEAKSSPVGHLVLHSTDHQGHKPDVVTVSHVGGGKYRIGSSSDMSNHVNKPVPGVNGYEAMASHFRKTLATAAGHSADHVVKAASALGTKWKIHSHKPLNESTLHEDVLNESSRHEREAILHHAKAEFAKREGDTEGHHHAMSAHHESMMDHHMSEWKAADAKKDKGAASYHMKQANKHSEMMDHHSDSAMRHEYRRSGNTNESYADEYRIAKRNQERSHHEHMHKEFLKKHAHAASTGDIMSAHSYKRRAAEHAAAAAAMKESIDEENLEPGFELVESHASHESAKQKMTRLNEKHPHTIHHVAQGRRTGRYFVVRHAESGTHIVESVQKPKLDPVGKEDADVNNDGKKNTNADKFIKNRRATIAKAIAKEKK